MDHRPKRLDQVSNKARLKNYNVRTELTWVGWIRRFILLPVLGQA